MRRCTGALLLFLGPALARAGATLPVDDAVRDALARSPDVASARAEVDAARGQLRQDAVLLANPELSASANVAGTKQSVEVTQPLSLTGEGWSARAADRASLDAATAALTRARLAVAADSRSAWADGVVTADRVRLARESLDLAGKLREAVEKKKAVGEASDLDVRLARLSEASAASAWMEARTGEDQARLRLVAMVGDRVYDLPDDPLVAAPAPTKPASVRSDVVAAQARVRASEAALARARKAALPAVAVGAFVEHDGADLSVGPSIGLEVPLWNRNQAEIARNSGDAAVARVSADQVTAVAASEADRSATLARDAETVAPLAATGLLDDARAALAEVDSAYRAGELDLADAIQIRNEVLDGEGAVLDLAGQVVQARLDLLLATDDDALLPEGAR